ncbi:hypothetical protein E4L96_19305 [Massilia arenosa]|uniref:Ricin B lectin domain-containing protein n=1 Tax=Zemynaea arenosa TaxID=2561931 RepID=A0A4Y9RZW7_9BURK|nr:ricin-type beta-trefoil lectin domain protein [Massilia arenosa]TFW13761.1 hypothetical protein E4L96_19305 [Massilia arenosa]
MPHIHAVRVLATLALAAASLNAAAADIAYISSSGGYLLHGSGGAVLADWRGQAPIAFSGYGQIKQGSQCLTGATGGKQLRWDGCRIGDKGQIWALHGTKLNNELGWCADVERGNQAAGTRVLAWQCNGGSNQQWRGLGLRPAQSVAAGISNPALRAKFLAAVNGASPGQVISMASGQVVAAGGANAVAAGGANAVAAGGANVIAAGGGNVVAPGGAN